MKTHPNLYKIEATCMVKLAHQAMDVIGACTCMIEALLTIAIGDNTAGHGEDKEDIDGIDEAVGHGMDGKAGVVVTRDIIVIVQLYCKDNNILLHVCNH